VSGQSGPASFGDYLRRAIHAAGFGSPSQFARAASLDPSVVLRWLSGSQRPTVHSLEKVAPMLGKSTSDLVRAAYPDRVGDDGRPQLHELAEMVNNMLASDSPIAPERRKRLREALEIMLESFKPDMQRRRSRGPARGLDRTLTADRKRHDTTRDGGATATELLA
jgi:transcriptional regulator with XRE-family HTH domain